MNKSAFVRERLGLEQGDLTAYRVDAIVNAANSSLLGGGGVDGDIHRAAGPQLLEACHRLGGCAPGDARITAGFGLFAGHVIHTVGPVWQGGERGEAEMLASCYRRSLALATEHGLKTIAFPAISCGTYGYPVDDAAAIAVREVCIFLEHDHQLRKVTLVCFSTDTFDAYRRACARLINA